MTTPGPQQPSRARDVPDLACFGYLAHADVLHVAAYPQANHGALVRSATTAVAGDAPIVALTCARLGLVTALVSNSVGSDAAGRRLAALLASCGVQQLGHHGPGDATPRLTVVSDDQGTRTWFAHLGHALTGLSRTNPSALARARMVYIDGYAVLATHAARALTATTTTPTLLNLGGDDLRPELEAAARGSRLVAVQTSLDEPDADRAHDLAEHLHTRLAPEATIVTLGRLGALVITATTGPHHIPAPAISRPRTHGAGAAFSAGYLHALTRQATQRRDHLAAAHHACRFATAACAAPVGDPGSEPTAISAT